MEPVTNVLAADSIANLQLQQTIKPSSMPMANGSQDFKQVLANYRQSTDLASNNVETSSEVKDNFYLDTKSLNKIKYGKNADDSLKQVADQFEALFVQQMLTRMRSATEVLGDKDNPLSRNSESMFQGMLDNQMAVSMTKNTSFGLADMLYQQLSSNLSSRGE